MRGESARGELAACVRCDPVLVLRLRRFVPEFDARPELLRGVLLAAPVAAGSAQAGYGVRWRQSIGVAHLAQTLAARAGATDPDAAWIAGLCHNIADYFDHGPSAAGAAADCLEGYDADGWLADAVLFHAEPLARGRAAHPLLRVTQLAYQLIVRAGAVDSIDVRAALSDLRLGAGEAAQLLAESRACVQQMARRFGLDDAPGGQNGTGFERLALLYAGQAAQAALHGHFRHAGAGGPSQVFARLRDCLAALFGIESACLFEPAADGLLRASVLWPASPALGALGIPPDDGHSVLTRARARNAPQTFARGAAESALVDEQIARLLDTAGFLCQPLALAGGQIGVLVAGDAAPGLSASPLWRFMLAECADALNPRYAISSAAVPAADETAPARAPRAVVADDIPRDRVRRAIHEVANPLTIMRNYVNLLSERLGSDSSVQRDLGIIGDEIERVARIVRGLTAAEEAAAPAVPLELASVNGIVSELVRMALGTLLAPNKVTVQIDLNPDVPPLPLHRDLLKQVLFNLAKNAVEAMPAGGHLRFSTRLVDADGARLVEIEVADTGPGLPPEVVAHLFEPVASSKGGEHAGLGLSISRSLVERMHGRLDCRSTPGGTHFLIRLPTLQNGQAPLTTTRTGSM